VASPCLRGREPTTFPEPTCFERETSWWEKRLNDDYAQALERIDSAHVGSLRNAQRAWLSFREAECDHRSGLWEDDDVRESMRAACMLDETAQRAASLIRTRLALGVSYKPAQ